VRETVEKKDTTRGAACPSSAEMVNRNTRINQGFQEIGLWNERHLDVVGRDLDLRHEWILLKHTPPVAAIIE
jgi:hypothetical protein